MGSFVGLVLMF